MLKKNIEKKKRSQRPNQWVGLSPKIGPTKQEKLKRELRKHKDFKKLNFENN